MQHSIKGYFTASQENYIFKIVYFTPLDTWVTHRHFNKPLLHWIPGGTPTYVNGLSTVLPSTGISQLFFKCHLDRRPLFLSTITDSTPWGGSPDLLSFTPCLPQFQTPLLPTPLQALSGQSLLS